MSKLRDTIKRIRREPQPQSVMQAVMYVVTPILGDLGWKTNTPASVVYQDHQQGCLIKLLVGLPKNVGFGEPRKRSRRFVLVDVRTPGSAFNGNTIDVSSLDKRVDIYIQTDGIVWAFYLPRGEVADCFDRLSQKHLIKDAEKILVSCLRYDRLSAGTAQKDAERKLEPSEEEIRRHWRQALRNPPQDLIALVQRHYFRQTGRRPDAERVTSVLKNEVR